MNIVSVSLWCMYGSRVLHTLLKCQMEKLKKNIEKLLFYETVVFRFISFSTTFRLRFAAFVCSCVDNFGKAVIKLYHIERNQLFKWATFFLCSNVLHNLPHFFHVLFHSHWIFRGDFAFLLFYLSICEPFVFCCCCSQIIII